TMKEVAALAEATPNSRRAISGTTVRSRPTIAPTKPLMNTRSKNCPRLARKPRTGIRGPGSAAVASECPDGRRRIGASPSPEGGCHVTAPVGRPDALLLRRRRRQILQHEGNELIAVAVSQCIVEAALVDYCRAGCVANGAAVGGGR